MFNITTIICRICKYVAFYGFQVMLIYYYLNTCMSPKPQQFPLNKLENELWAVFRFCLKSEMLA